MTSTYLTRTYTNPEHMMLDDFSEWLIRYRSHSSSAANGIANLALEMLQKIEEDFDCEWKNVIDGEQHSYVKHMRMNAFCYWKEFRDNFEYNFRIPQLGHARFRAQLKMQPGKRTPYERERDDYYKKMKEGK